MEAALEQALAAGSDVREVASGIAAGGLAPAMATAGDAEAADFWRSAADGQGNLSAEGAGRLAAAAVHLLRERCDEDVWNFVHRLEQTSENLHWATRERVVLASEAEQRFRAALVALAARMVEAAVADPGRRVPARERARLKQVVADWRRNPELLDIWFGLRAADYFLYGRDALAGMLDVVASIDVGAFMALLSRFDDPYAVRAALHDAGAPWSFDLWRRLLAAAPDAFEDDGAWSGSSVAPLLLVIGLDTLRGATAPHRRPLVHEEEDTAATAAAACVTGLAAAVAGAVARRRDRAGLGARWAAWLARAAMSGLHDAPVPDPSDVRHPGHVETALIQALARVLPPEAWSAERLTGAALWERWCHRAAATVASFDGQRPLPGLEDFLAAWTLTPEDWAGRRGGELRELAGLFVTFGRRPDAFGTRLLGAPFAAAGAASGNWADLWRRTATLREVAEFGAGAGSEERWDSRARSAELVRLAFGMGLAALDYAVAAEDGSAPKRADTADVGRLFQRLAAAQREMARIDPLGEEFWTDAFKHLAVRRGLWDAGSRNIKVFPENFEPSLARFFETVGGDAAAVVSLVAVLKRNQIADVFVAGAVARAGLDAVAVIGAAERLAEIDARRSLASPSDLAAARAVLAQRSESKGLRKQHSPPA